MPLGDHALLRLLQKVHLGARYAPYPMLHNLGRALFESADGAYPQHQRSAGYGLIPRVVILHDVLAVGKVDLVAVVQGAIAVKRLLAVNRRIERIALPALQHDTIEGDEIAGVYGPPAFTNGLVERFRPMQGHRGPVHRNVDGCSRRAETPHDDQESREHDDGHDKARKG